MTRMTSLRRLVALVTTLVVALVVASLASGASSARTVVDRCTGPGPIAVHALAGLERSGCSLAGRTVHRGDVSVVVPPAGVSVVGEGLSTRGDVIALQVTNTGHAVVTSGGAEAPTGSEPASAEVISPPACRDQTFNLEGGHAWHRSFRYRINLTKKPTTFQAATVIKQVRAANYHLRTGNNTCGRPRIAAPAGTYLGRTSAKPDIKVSSSTVGCGTYNTTNVVAFGDLPGNLLGWTCFWWISGGQINAADVMMDSGGLLATQLPAPCDNRWDFEGAVTHEMGHVYGLAHTGSGHANLTMQHLLRPCSTYARTLGLGDWLGLKKLYGVQ
jgi:hypothetical protein